MRTTEQQATITRVIADHQAACTAARCDITETDRTDGAVVVGAITYIGAMVDDMASVIIYPDGTGRAWHPLETMQ